LAGWSRSLLTTLHDFEIKKFADTTESRKVSVARYFARESAIWTGSLVARPLSATVTMTARDPLSGKASWGCSVVVYCAPRAIVQ
jgi:hypothetical protein